MPKFTVISPVEHNGKRYEIGSALNVAADVAEALLSAGAIAPPEEARLLADVTEVVTVGAATVAAGGGSGQASA
jgi:hypothetical protein